MSRVSIEENFRTLVKSAKDMQVNLTRMGTYLHPIGVDLVRRMRLDALKDAVLKEREIVTSHVKTLLEALPEKIRDARDQFKTVWIELGPFRSEMMEYLHFVGGESRLLISRVAKESVRMILGNLEVLKGLRNASPLQAAFASVALYCSMRLIRWSVEQSFTIMTIVIGKGKAIVLGQNKRHEAGIERAQTFFVRNYATDFLDYTGVKLFRLCWWTVEQGLVVTATFNLALWSLEGFGAKTNASTPFHHGVALVAGFVRMGLWSCLRLRPIRMLLQYPDVICLSIVGLGLFRLWGLTAIAKAKAKVNIQQTINIYSGEKKEKKIDIAEKILYLGDELGYRKGLKLVGDITSDITSYGLGPIITKWWNKPRVAKKREFSDQWYLISPVSGAFTTITKAVSLAVWFSSKVFYVPYMSEKYQLPPGYISFTPPKEYKVETIQYHEDDGQYYNDLKFVVQKFGGLYEQQKGPEGEKEVINPNDEVDLPGDSSLLSGSSSEDSGDEDKPDSDRADSSSSEGGDSETQDVSRDRPLRDPGFESHRQEKEEEEESLADRRKTRGDRPVDRALAEAEKRMLTFDVNMSAKLSKMLTATNQKGLLAKKAELAVALPPNHSKVLGRGFYLDPELVQIARLKPNEIFGDIDGIKGIGYYKKPVSVPPKPQWTYMGFMDRVKVLSPVLHKELTKLCRVPVDASGNREFTEFVKYRLPKLTVDMNEKQKELGVSYNEFIATILSRYIAKDRVYQSRDIRSIQKKEFTSEQLSTFPGLTERTVEGFQTKNDAFEHSKKVATEEQSKAARGEPTTKDHTYTSIPVPKTKGSRKDNPMDYRCREALSPEFWRNLEWMGILEPMAREMEEDPNHPFSKFTPFYDHVTEVVHRLMQYHPDVWLATDIRDMGASMNKIHFDLIGEFIKLHTKAPRIFEGKDEWNHYIDRLVKDLYESRVVLTWHPRQEFQNKGIILEKKSGLADGIYRTNFFDGLGSMINIAFHFARMWCLPTFPRQEFMDLYDTPSPVAIFGRIGLEIHADNNLLAIPDPISKMFTKDEVKKSYAMLGMDLKLEETELIRNQTPEGVMLMGFRISELEGMKNHWVLVRPCAEGIKSLAYHPERMEDNLDYQLESEGMKARMRANLMSAACVELWNLETREIINQEWQRLGKGPVNQRSHKLKKLKEFLGGEVPQTAFGDVIDWDRIISKLYFPNRRHKGYDLLPRFSPRKKWVADLFLNVWTTLESEQLIGWYRPPASVLDQIIIRLHLFFMIDELNPKRNLFAMLRFLHACGLAPIYEEILKRRSKWFRFGIPLWEFLALGEPTIQNLIFRFGIHEIFRMMPLSYGILAHSLFNITGFLGLQTLRLEEIPEAINHPYHMRINYQHMSKILEGSVGGVEGSV